MIEKQIKNFAIVPTDNGTTLAYTMSEIEIDEINNTGKVFNDNIKKSFILVNGSELEMHVEAIKSFLKVLEGIE